MKLLFPYLLAVLLFYAVTGCGQTRKITPGISIQTNADSIFGFSYFIPGNYIRMEVDVLNNVYLLTNSYQLKKMDAKGDSIGVFNDVKRFGNPSYIDVSNPFKILVYYKNFSTAVILDRQLTSRSTINLRKQGIFIVRAVTTSYDNNLWLFDEQDFKLKKINDEGKVLLESTDMRSLVDSVPSPEQLSDSEDFVYLYDHLKGFYVFDHYGALKNNIPYKNWQSVSVSGKKLYGFSDNILFTYELQSMTLKKYPLPASFKNSESIKAMNGKVYLLSKAGVTIFDVR